MTDFPKSYNPAEAEKRWYALWEEQGYFRPEVNPGGKPYSIVIPPPNITGSLHMGHALNATLQDVLIRWRRMKGERALWVPGTDHAGIATQNVVERELAREGTDRHALGREAFIQRVWQWKEEYGGRITHQLRKLGASADWSRERFTLDEGLSRAVREVFVRLYEDGLIYRDKRLINWCPRCRTALSDLEVEYEDLEGTLTYIKYPRVGAPGGVTVATTRPETMLGDTAVAVNPEDERYRDLIGKTVELPLTGRTIPVIADPEVDPAFGTGAVKITPAHDFNDEAVAKRQTPPLPAITVIAEDGTMSMNAGPRYAGLDRYEARRKVVDDLGAEGLVAKTERHVHAVGHCYRCKTVVEPASTPQWFVKVGPLAEEALEAVRSGRIRIVPESWLNSYYAWMENIRDWCITRQIWWGHRLPVWYCASCGETIVSRDDPTACPACSGKELIQDPDVLDTWFSSALWPFSTLGWPERTEDLGAFYPTSVLVTAFDILFFWVARMIMMGLRFMGEEPFRDVYIHALVRDAEGQKMSKSKGNVVDPLLLIDRYGADAFRFTLAAFAAQGRDIKFAEERVEGNRHFINKLWNATRFILMNVEAGHGAPSVEELGERLEEEESPLAVRWVMSRLADTRAEVEAALGEYRFNDAASALYQFAWHEFCDWYIEMAKTEMSAASRDCLLLVLENLLRMLQPFMPFLAEDIWQRLPLTRPTESIVTAPWPAALARDPEAEREMAMVMDAVGGVRSIRGEMNIPPAQVLETHVKTASGEVEALLRSNLHYVSKLARAEVKGLGTGVAKPGGAYTSVKDGLEVYVKLAGIDVDAELTRLGREKKKLEGTLGVLHKKLHNPDFLERAPAHVVRKEQQKYDELAQRQEKLAESIAKIKGLEV
ncbi:MAG: valine--tRNA ligase [Nitrospirota bacterium]